MDRRTWDQLHEAQSHQLEAHFLISRFVELSPESLSLAVQDIFTDQLKYIHEAVAIFKVGLTISQKYVISGVSFVFHTISADLILSLYVFQFAIKGFITFDRL